ncbi:sodium channel regulatory subunit beta-3-like [Anguilla rostrata]|uniref:sodium channel regulatory subunit beta-3-like n=1 Tax=Anguilla rostrata TaxID=7938 RepID=UPI0030CD6CC0
MTPAVTLVFQSLPLLILIVPVMQQVCVEVDSETDAVKDQSIRLTCISCQKRAEITMESQVNWYYINKDKSAIHILQYVDGPLYLEGRWMDRLLWNGSSNMQDLSVLIINVTLNDTGTYKCEVIRRMPNMPAFRVTKFINLVVREKALPNITAFYSEIMMYVVLTLMSVWLLLAVVFCFRKIARAEARAQDSSNDCLSIPSDNKDDMVTTIED